MTAEIFNFEHSSYTSTTYQCRYIDIFWKSIFVDVQSGLWSGAFVRCYWYLILRCQVVVVWELVAVPNAASFFIVAVDVATLPVVVHHWEVIEVGTGRDTKLII